MNRLLTLLILIPLFSLCFGEYELVGKYTTYKKGKYISVKVIQVDNNYYYVGKGYHPHRKQSKMECERNLRYNFSKQWRVSKRELKKLIKDIRYNKGYLNLKYLK